MLASAKSRHHRDRGVTSLHPAYSERARVGLATSRRPRGAFLPVTSLMAKRGGDANLKVAATNNGSDAKPRPQDAGLVLSPSKRCKISPDSVVMITPAASTKPFLDGLSADEVRGRRLPTPCAPVTLAHAVFACAASAALTAALCERGLHLLGLHHPAGPHHLRGGRREPAHAVHEADRPQRALRLLAHGHRHRSQHGHPYGALRRSRHHPLQ